ncbi:YqgE/AlgH family protein [Chitinophaga arvensicola]|uniref:Putative transcriptional regulator n=1 Tax=Chitinophaga arvensicola TaxID=29529 RepID=A0A1I0RH99_9BACT|nr:YqgE/AlgH family protein [Chitinophaga arvensicola]SEW40046.1 putative transcriptional regulator [Chitinophaga arvensicola]
MKAGIYIRSTALLDDTYFEKTILFITEYNEKGAMAFVVNKPFPRRFNELAEFSDSPPFPLSEGGPVDLEHLYFIHRRPELIAGGVPVKEPVYFGGDFQTAVELMNNKGITEKDIRLFIGYCGWDANELEEEIAEGSWEILEEVELF